MEGTAAVRLTVIMPAYNAEAYIEGCVRSVLDQSFRELELVVVDDGSTDRTGDILGALAAEDHRVTVLSAPNRGPAMARNLALERLSDRSEYVMFMDADDCLLPGAAEYAMAGADGADLVIFGFCIMNSDGSQQCYFEPEQHLNAGDIGGALTRLYKANLLNQVWGKLFRASLLRAEAVRFPDYRWGEDRLFIFDCLERTERLTVLPQCMYRYVMHPGESLITKYYDRKLQVCLEADRRMGELCRRFGVTEERDARYMFAKSVFSCITTLFTSGCPLSYGEKREYVRHIAESGQVRERCRDVFGGPAVNFLCAVVRGGSVTLILAVFRLVALSGRLTPALFTRLKHRK